MNDTENLVLEHLRAIRGGMDGLNERMGRIEVRFASVETTLVGMRKDIANMYGDVVSQTHQYDRLVERIERIEKRLTLANGD